MAGVLKLKDVGGVVRTITVPKVRDVAGVVRSLAFIRVRDAGGVLREVFSSTSAPAPAGASITPSYQTFSGRGYTKSATFTASSMTGAPTSFQWGLLDGSGTVASGVNTATATLSVYVDPGSTLTSTFFCDMVVGGLTQRATCMLTYSNMTADTR